VTEAQGGTFADVELGMDPRGLRPRIFDGVAGRIYFRRWLDQSIDGLKSAVENPAASGTRASQP
jgi:hypothetical protein